MSKRVSVQSIVSHLHKLGSPVLKLAPEPVRPLLERVATKLLVGARQQEFRRKMSSKVTDAQVNNLADRVLKVDPAQANGAYRDYIKTQIKKSYSLSDPILGKELRSGISFLINSIDSALPTNRTGLKCLCLGPRHAAELDAVQNRCRVDVIGLDLFSADPRIIVADMHDMPFSNNSFDIILASHVLEHSHNIHKVLDEVIRVLKNDSIIALEVPTKFQPNATDRVDLISAGNIVELLSNNLKEVIYREDEPVDPIKNRSRTRLVARIQKPALNKDLSIPANLVALSSH